MLTSLGRRAYLVKYFKEVLGNDGKVLFVIQMINLLHSNMQMKRLFRH